MNILGKNQFIFLKFIHSLEIYLEDFNQIYKYAYFAKHLTLIIELKLEFFGIFGNPPTVHIQTFTFLNTQKQQFDRNLKNKCETVF